MAFTLSRNIMKYLQRKRKERLYKQWVEEGVLPPEQSLDSIDGQSAEEAELASDEIQQSKAPDYSMLTDINRGVIRLPVRYVLILLSAVAVLLVALAVVITVLIMG